jgi:hypothetical protein
MQHASGRREGSATRVLPCPSGAISIYIVPDALVVGPIVSAQGIAKTATP